MAIVEPTIDELDSFIKTQTAQGRIGQTSGSSMLSTIRRIKPMLEPQEASDVESLDLAGLMHRFANLTRGEVSANTMASYKSRLTSAIKMFSEWRANPSGWRPRGGGGPKPKPKKQPKPGRVDVPSHDELASAESPEASPAQDGKHIVYPFPLRDGVIVRLHGLPTDLKPADVERISQFLRLLCVD
ncbi:MAG: hypothetical protein ACFCVE_15950 [Phycisphaerae bacterium]